MAQIVLYYTLGADYLVEWEKFACYAKEHFPNIKVSKSLEYDDLCTDTCECVERRVTSLFPQVIFYNGYEPKVFYDEMNSDCLIKFVQNNMK